MAGERGTRGGGVCVPVSAGKAIDRTGRKGITGGCGCVTMVL